MNANETALVLIGFQNDYFARDGILHSVIEQTARSVGVLENTLALLQDLRSTPVLTVATPIVFSLDYHELNAPVGILKAIKQAGAFKYGSVGAETIPELLQFGDAIQEVPGKQGLNAFSNTALDDTLQQQGIKHVVLAGVVTSVCIDSTGRSAHEKGYDVTVLSDCTSGRTLREQEFYCSDILPIYANVLQRRELLAKLELDATPAACR